MQDESTSSENDPILSALTDDGDATPESNESDNIEVETEEEQTTEETTAETEEQTEESDEVQVDEKELARRGYEERQRKLAERRDSFMSSAQNITEKYVNEAEDEYDQRTRRNEAEIDKMKAEQYVNNIEHQESQLVNEFARAKSDKDLQIFNPESPEYNAKAYDKALKDYNAGYIHYDANGNIVGLKGSLYEHLKETSELLKESVKSGAIQQVRATKQMKASADMKPSATPKAPDKDPILDILRS